MNDTPTIVVEPNGKGNAPEHPRFPGVFVTKKKKASGKFSDHDTTDSKKPDRNSDSPTSDLGSDQCSSEAGISTSTAAYSSSFKEIEGGVDSSRSCGEVTEQQNQPQGDSEEEADDGKDNSKRLRRKKSKDKAENPAADAIRYKTKMCKNWQLTQKCPYGPRCLFAHGTKELRSHTLNQAAISFASCSTSPERQFYALGRFPSFMPIPYGSPENGEESLQPVEQKDTAPTVPTAMEGSDNLQQPGNVKVTTHKPYSFSSPPKQDLTSPPTSVMQQTNYCPGNYYSQQPEPESEPQGRYSPNVYEQSRIPFPFPNCYGGGVSQNPQYCPVDFYNQQTMALNALSCAYRSMQCSLGSLSMEPLRR